MLKHKITGVIMGTLMLSGVVIGASSINNTKITNDNTKVVNKVLLSAPSSLVGERAVVVNTDNSPLVLYSNASGSSNITSYISVGEMLTIESSGDNFYKVKVQETGAVGYISAHNLQIITSGVNDAFKSINKEGYIINVSSVVNLRANATMSSNILAKLSNNTKINVLGKQGQWYKVNCNGTVGYIYQEYIGLSNQAIKSTSSSKKYVAGTGGHVNNIDKPSKVSTKVSNSSSTKNVTKLTNVDNFVAKYAGTYIVNKDLGTITKMPSGFNKKVKAGDKLILTPKLYEFNGVTIHNPKYMFIPYESGVFQNSKVSNMLKSKITFLVATNSKDPYSESVYQRNGVLTAMYPFINGVVNNSNYNLNILIKNSVFSLTKNN